MPVKIVQTSRWKFYRHPVFKPVLDGLITCSAAYLPYLMDTHLSPNFRPSQSILAFLVLVMLTGTAVAVYSYWFGEKDVRYGKLDDLEALIHTFHAILLNIGNVKENTILRVCVHQKDGPDSYRRITSYSNDETRPAFSSQKQPISLGIVGEIFVEDKLGMIVKKTTAGKEDRIDVLRKMKFTDEQIRDLWPDSHCWCAVGIGSDSNGASQKKVRFVLYLDSNDSEFFGSRNTDKRRKQLEILSVGALDYLTKAGYVR